MHRVFLALRWKDKKDVWMFTSSHEPKMLFLNKKHYLTGLPKSKPACVMDYNKEWKVLITLI
jgi:hypothetical protein